MSKPRLFQWAWLPLLALGLLVGNGGWGAEPGGEAARLDCYAHSDGVNYFALTLEPRGNLPAAGSRDILVLFETSAGQAGQYRTQALAVLQQVLSNLGAKDRVALMSVGLKAVPLSQGFVAPGSPEMAAAMAKLNAQVPVGTTDMEKALMAAAGAFTADAQGAREVLYIGKGMSLANLLSPEQLGALSKALVDHRISMTSYAIGPRLDLQLLGVLAAHTGGMVIPQGQSVEQDAQKLAAAIRGTVLWPGSVTWPAAMSEVFPKDMPPLRSDRPSVLIGTYQGQEPLAIEMAAEGPAGAEKLSWTVQPGPSDQRNSYLATLVERARTDGGLSLPLLDAASLTSARDQVSIGDVNSLELARQALALGNLDDAQRLVGELLRRNPRDKQALAISNEIAKRRQGGAPFVAAMAAPGGAAAAQPSLGGASDLTLVGPGDVRPPGAMAESVSRDRKLIAQVIQTEVGDAVNRARRQMATDPEGATQNLKLTLERVRQVPELSPDVREQLVGVIEAALREANRRTIEEEFRRQQRLEVEAAARERMLVNEGLQRKQEKLKQLLERFNSLMEEGLYRSAEEEVAMTAQKVAPDNSVPVSATLNARQKGYYEDMVQLRVKRQKAFVDALFAVEKAHVPFNDDIPIIYPDAEWWRNMSAERIEKYSSMDLAKRGPAEKKIENALKESTELHFPAPGQPLQDVIDYLKDSHGIMIQIDKKALDDVGIGSDATVEIDLKGISLRSALKLMLRPLDLTYIVKDEVLLITTPDEANNRLVTRVYPVADLVLPVGAMMNTIMNGMGGMGMMGGMDMMGGGMGGGGMGGGGMGGGGMGGGMGGGGMGGGMGGGFFNVPQRHRILPPGVVPQVPAGGFQAFAVQDDLTIAPKQPTPASVNKAVHKAVVQPQKDAASAEKPRAAIPQTDDPAVLDKYFAANQPAPAAVREAVRNRMTNRQYGQVVALIQAALRHGQVQPWMYEAMVLAMQAGDRPNDEIEQAVMSAVDFAQNPLDLMYIGIYVSRLGLDQRALQIFRQVSKLAPLCHEPYWCGLQAAQRLNDLDGIRWATTGILSQAWPKKQAEVWQTAVRTANATLEKLRSEKRLAEWKQFQAALDAAVERDVVAIVRFTGDADVDLLVEEPSGSVCSLRNPRTTGGGILLGSDLSTPADRDVEGRSEAYVCPKGFDGTYRMLVRRAWGNVTAGKVTVEVQTHFRSKDAVCCRKTISLDQNGEAVVAFDLKGGRRTGPLQAEQVANAVANQVVLNQQILSQQLAAAADPSAAQSMAIARQQQVGGGIRFPFIASGAVGYQPIIITLPVGGSLSATAVISADRRYVRVTPMPLFSGIGQVSTFNTATGQGTTQSGGNAGNQGFSGLSGGGGGGGMGGGGMGGGMFP